MATRKRPPVAPPQPSANQGIAGIQQSPLAITGAQVATATTEKKTSTKVEKPAELPTAAQLTTAQSALDTALANEAELGQALAVLGDPIYKGKTYKRTDLEAMQRLRKQLSEFTAVRKKAEKNLSAIRKPLDEANKKIGQIKAKLNPSQAEIAAGAKAPTSTQRRQLGEELSKLEQSVAASTAGFTLPGPAGPQGMPAVVTPREVTSAAVVTPREVTSAADLRRFEQTGAVAPQPTPATTLTPTPTPTGTTGAGGGGATTGGAGGGGKAPKGAPANPKKGDQYTGPKGATFEYDGKKWNRIQKTDWSGIVQQEFGSLWDVYNSNADVKAVLDKSVQEGWFNDADKLAASLQNTGWYRTTEQSARQFAIKQSTDPATLEDQILTGMETFRQSALASGFTFDDATLRRLSTDKIKYGWSEQQTVNAVGSEAVAQAQGRGAQGLTDLRSGFVGQQLRKIAKSYAQKPSETQLDSFINDIMTGKKTQQQFTDLMRNGAKTQFRSLASAIDQGQDVETAMYGYQQAAQSTLGNVIDTSTIDWTTDKWNKALNFRDEKTGEYRQMDLWEWNKYLRKLPEWQQTDEAKQTYQNVAYALAQGFGKIA